MSRQTNIYLYRILICILLLSLNQLSGAQNAPTVNSILEGTVVDENTNQPLEGANIAIEGLRIKPLPMQGDSLNYVPVKNFRTTSL
ncbi:carboxypeptidase-like regulatory domain-containing protein [Niabella sp. W65]|nr:carboxypeptidase-like regulatory domain-containing protein [Niabella sp. W65]MCH7363822.1 carboxypeptidase-like regulatory domain-containing protein [Niabella sp. W65]